MSESIVEKREPIIIEAVVKIETECLDGKNVKTFIVIPVDNSVVLKDGDRVRVTQLLYNGVEHE